MILEEDKAKEELKRVDHLIYVTLKYTRTCDVIKNIVKRLISSFDAIMLEGLEYLKAKKKIKLIPTSNTLRTELFFTKFKKRGVKKYLDLYNLLKRIDKCEKISKKEEYRKHVTLIAELENGPINVDVPMLFSYYKTVKEFVDLINEWMKK